jgi:ribosomal protein L11 methyltransferase
LGGRILDLSPKKWWNPQKESDAPLKIGKQLIVVKDLKQKKYWSKQFDRPILTIPQGLAFGSGNHHTTRMCLQELVRAQPFSSLLDIGTGSGILAIASGTLGCKTIRGIDNDPIAIRVAKENSSLNQIRKIVFNTETIEKVRLKQKYEVVVANLFSELLVLNAKRIKSLVAPSGKIILSGVRSDQIREVKSAFRNLTLLKDRRSGKWCCFVYKNAKAKH